MLTYAAYAPYIARMSDFHRNRFIAPPAAPGNPQPDRTRLPAHMRDALQRPDPMRDDEASAHLLTSTPPISIPGARLRVVDTGTESTEEALRDRIGLYAIDQQGTTRVAQIFLDFEQAEILAASLNARLEALRARIAQRTASE